MTNPGRVLITGAAGFVGRHLQATLRQHWPGIDLLTPETDIRDRAALTTLIRETTPATIIHLAAIASVMQVAQAQDEAWQVNLHGTLNLGHAILAHAPTCQLIFASSADTYGATFRAGLALDETAPLAPVNIYGATKAAADLALGSLAPHGLRVVRLRPFNHIGPGQSADYVIASFARQIARIQAGAQDPVLKVGRLDTWRDFLDVRDVCAAYAACIGARDDLAPGTILNIASGTPRRIGAVLDEMIALAGIEAHVEEAAPLVRATDIVRACGNAAQAATALGWAPVHGWGETLTDILADWRQR
jgi:GDP-4-dehydro-6-deoxy-D-mannose reductase